MTFSVYNPPVQRSSVVVVNSTQESENSYVKQEDYSDIPDKGDKLFKYFYACDELKSFIDRQAAKCAGSRRRVLYDNFVDEAWFSLFEACRANTFDPRRKSEYVSLAKIILKRSVLDSFKSATKLSRASKKNKFPIDLFHAANDAINNDPGRRMEAQDSASKIAQQLSPRNRILLESIVDDKPVDQIASEMGSNYNRVCVALHEAKRQARKIIEPDSKVVDGSELYETLRSKPVVQNIIRKSARSFVGEGHKDYDEYISKADWDLYNACREGSFDAKRESKYLSLVKVIVKRSMMKTHAKLNKRALVEQSMPSIEDDGETQVFESVDPRSADVVDELYFKELLRKDIVKVLPETLKPVFRLILEDKDFKEIAEALGISPGTARVRMHRVNTAIKDMLGLPQRQNTKPENQAA